MGAKRECMHYLVFDVVALSGTHVAQRSFSERLQLIHSTLYVPYHAETINKYFVTSSFLYVRK